MFDPVESKIIDIVDSRRKKALEEYFYSIPIDERRNVKYFISDLNETYRGIHGTFFPESVHAVDSFHVIKNMSDLFDRIRVRVMKGREGVRDERDSTYWIFKKFSRMLLKDPDRIPYRTYDFRKCGMTLDSTSIIDHMLRFSDELKLAYRLKEDYRDFNGTRNSDETDEFEELMMRFLRSDSEEMRQFGGILVRWETEIRNSFIRIDGWRLSNGNIERANRMIKLCFENAYGFSNFPRTRNRVMLAFNKELTLTNTEPGFSNKYVKKPRGKYNKNH